MTVIKKYNENTDQWEAIAVGPRGDPGPGFANGGSTDAVLVKSSNTDFDTEWTNNPTFNTLSLGLTTQQTNTAISEGSNAEILSEWSLIEYFSSKAIITAIGEGQTQISEFLITHDGTDTYMTEYGVLTTNGTLFTANSYIDGNNLVIDVTSTLTSDTTFTIHETLFRDQASIGFDFNTDLQTGDGNLDLQQSFGSEDLNQ